LKQEKVIYQLYLAHILMSLKVVTASKLNDLYIFMRNN